MCVRLLLRCLVVGEQLAPLRVEVEEALGFEGAGQAHLAGPEQRQPGIVAEQPLSDAPLANGSKSGRPRVWSSAWTRPRPSGSIRASMARRFCVVVERGERGGVEPLEVGVEAEPSEQGGLGDQPDGLQAAALAGPREAGEVDVGGDVLGADVAEGVAAEGVAAIGEEGAVAALRGVKLWGGVAVVEQEEGAAIEGGGGALQPVDAGEVDLGEAAVAGAEAEALEVGGQGVG